jgi:hypothetical protein
MLLLRMRARGMACELLLGCRLLVRRRTMILVVVTSRLRAGECVVPPCLDLSCLSLLRAFMLVVSMHKISACDKFEAAEDHDVTSASLVRRYQDQRFGGLKARRRW